MGRLRLRSNGRCSGQVEFDQLGVAVEFGEAEASNLSGGRDFGLGPGVGRGGCTLPFGFEEGAQGGEVDGSGGGGGL